MNDDINTKRTELANQMAAAGAALLDFTGTAAALAAIPDTEPQQYVAAGAPENIAAILPATITPQRRQKHGERPSADDLEWDNAATSGDAPAELQRICEILYGLPIAPTTADLDKAAEMIARIERAAVSAATKPTADLFQSVAMLAGCLKQGIIDDQAFIDRLESLLATKPAAAPAVPEKLTRSMCGTKDYCEGWNDCVDEFSRLAATPATSTPAAPAEQVASGDGWPTPADLLAEALDNIAEQWTECMYEASSGDIDIGASLRAEFAKLNLAIPAASTLATEPELSRAHILEEAAKACEQLYTGLGGPIDDPHPDAVIANGAINDCVNLIRRMRSADPAASTTGAAQTAEQVRDQALEDAAMLFDESPHAEQFHCNIAEQIRELKGAK